MRTQKKPSLQERFTASSGHVLLSGIQALVRLPMEQMRRDRARQLKTGTFISGYRGSPLGGYDMQLSKNRALLEELNIHFQPGVNEELGATAVWGSQQVNLFDDANVDGVCGIWYGKTPGVDRSNDAFRHGNAAGSSRHGGVLVVAGDDHGCKSSTYPGQSEFAFVDMHMPILNPSSIQEVLDYGLYGFELSRFSGCWVAMIALSENMDSLANVWVDPERIQIQCPEDVELPDGGLNIRLQDMPMQQEERLWRYKRPAALAFCRRNRLNKVVLENPDAKLGIVTAGKAHLDFMQALQDLGIDEARAKQLGIRVFKVGMTYPLDIQSIREFARDLEYLFVVEEKRSLIEVQLKEELYNIEVVDPHFPRIIGKLDPRDNPLLPTYGELSPGIIADVLLKLIPEARNYDSVQHRAEVLDQINKLCEQPGVESKRGAFFCSGCPHNTSTKVPAGSRALAGIGCHYMAQNMERETYTFSQMGGEGVSWIGQSRFTETQHVFVNLGDGTYFHSGILAIRASIAAKVNITYKILYNDAVAMTGGQPVDGELGPDLIAKQVLAEGVKRLIWVMDDVHKYHGRLDVPAGVEVRSRDDMDAIQRELREVKGTTCILYDQPCANELRRKRKRGLIEEPCSRVFINDLVCEGCGDCSVESNCISVEPLETEFGTKRKINQTSCNKDFSCIKGFCPSFVTVEGGSIKKVSEHDIDFTALTATLPEPAMLPLRLVHNILVAGIGGTGVVTVGALLSMAAHIEGKSVTTLDQTGLAQKGGAVYSHIRIANEAAQLHAVRISEASADVLLACDLVAASEVVTCLSRLHSNRTSAVVNTHHMPTSAFVMGKAIANETRQIINLISGHSKNIELVDGYSLSERALGAATTSNIFMLGYAWQKGLLPVQKHTLYQAIELNAVAVEENVQAFNLGRLAAVDLGKLQGLLGSEANTLSAPETDLQHMVDRRASFLVDYQNQSYSDRYRYMVEQVGKVEQTLAVNSDELSRAVARYAFKLMAYKDEYEVARLHTSDEFRQKVEQTFTGNYRLHYHLAAPVLSPLDASTGIARKRRFGPWMQWVFRLIVPFKVLRGTALDIFSYTEERRCERDLIERYFSTVEQILEKLNKDNYQFACRIARLPEQIKGYGQVKMQSIREVEPRWQNMLGSYSSGDIGFSDKAVESSVVKQCDLSTDLH